MNKQNCGRKCKDYGEQLENLRHIPLSKKGTIILEAHATEVPKSTLFWILKKEKSISEFQAQFLTQKNKKDYV